MAKKPSKNGNRLALVEEEEVDEVEVDAEEAEEEEVAETNGHSGPKRRRVGNAGGPVRGARGLAPLPP